MKQVIAWTIAGSDSSGGAGIQADLKTFQDFGVHGCSITTAITAQNSEVITHIEPVSANAISSKIDALQYHFIPKAIKIGMLCDVLGIEKIIDFIKTYSGYVILDPVMISTSGKNLFFPAEITYLSTLKKIFPYINLLTPNLTETERLLNCDLFSYKDIENAAKKILTLGVKSVLIKGGHFKENNFSQDYWTNGTESFWLSTPRYPENNYRGTGCTLSSAMTACLALGYTIKDALVIAKMYITRGIRLSEKINNHAAFLKYNGWPEDEIDLPYLSHNPIDKLPLLFSSCRPDSLGIYPIIDNISWLKKLLPLGVKTIQLRIKNKTKNNLENEIKSSIEFSRKYNANIFINDYWELAIQFGAYGVHLGQEDLNTANIEKIRKAGLRLGISTHCYYEVARAHALNPSYIACGPIFATTSKIMAFPPQGIAQFKKWRQMLNYPLVAIGGINLDNISEIIAANADGIGIISAITHAKDPVKITKKLLTML